jgi:8-oxo-dGTP pyrophosphatase MutT (NUDIX family)
MAFPGGRVDPGDAHPRDAAERETLEEVGLARCATPPASGGSTTSRAIPPTQNTLIISGFVYALPAPAPLSPNHEVRETFWFLCESSKSRAAR